MRPAVQALELNRLFVVLERYVSSDLGRGRLAAAMDSPFLDGPEQARVAFAEIAEAMGWLRAAEDADRRTLTPAPRFDGLRDVRTAVERLDAEGKSLEAFEIFGLVELLDRAEETKQRLWRERVRRPSLGEHADRIGELAPLTRELRGKILPNGEVSDLASTALSRIRRQIEQQRVTVHTSLERFVRKHFEEGVLQDDYATIRNGRSVVPVKSTWKGRVEGVVHAASSTGQTVFVEPLETITENNKLVRLVEDEQREVLRILREMTDRLREHKVEVREAVAALGDLEMVFSKARFGREFRCCVPEIAEETLTLEWARHPILQDVLGRAGDKVKPLSLALDQGRRVLVVSGPNAGGKTVVLKTVGLLSLMVQAAIPVPAARAVFPWFDETLADIGDAQSIEASLSTFSAHIQTLKRMLNATRGRSLVIVDELAGATDPAEGGAFAVAVVDHLLERGAFALVSTHLPGLKIHAANSKKILSAAMGFDTKTLSPTYEMLTGVPGESAGIAMAERLGIPAEVVARAREALASQEEEATKFLGELRRRIERNKAESEVLEISKRRLEERERELEQRFAEREKKKLAELEYRFSQAMRTAQVENERKIQAAVAKLDQAQEASRGQASKARREAARAQRAVLERIETAASETLGKESRAGESADESRLAPGVRVKLGGFGAEGEVLRELGEGRWEVRAGQLKMQVAAADISEIPSDSDAKGRGGLPAGVTFESSTAPPSLLDLSEINVIGQRVDEAESTVDKFLDQAVLADVKRIRVVHGHGTNALRRSLWKMFANHVQVNRYYQAEAHEGGAGATIVEMRA